MNPGDEADSMLDQLEAEVEAFQEEAVHAVMLHESWKPTAYDTALHERMGNSYSTHTFQIIRMALRRELILTLMRIWDSNRSALGLTAVRESLRNEAYFEALVRRRAARLNMRRDPVERVREALADKRDEVKGIVEKYMQGGVGAPVMEHLKALRNERLAHRQLKTPTEPGAREASEEKIEELYQDTLKAVTVLLSLVSAHYFDIATDAANVYGHHARFFWAAARGERTEGHPNFRPAQVMDREGGGDVA
ncbi:AbiU2 domain-containing protein [Cupriavidus numazuensis]|uniref:HEPN AbiU2-like domain-containing protein n=1 Tax=Cupriavidus numazuensis TaxID=221992 RepID=A0ABN7Q690_9BURK|nr:hypothetical protein [Cupriavidus numazuensis]CAG2154675.1 hypothetical protein LMG26411_04684 [Cupriavidus numazuensis]